MSDNLEIEKAQELANIHTDINKITDEDVSKHVKDSIKTLFHLKFPDSDFDLSWESYKNINCFPAVGNVYDIDQEVNKETHYVMRLVASWHIENALKALKFDTKNDPNLKSDIETANIGTAGRIAKIWGGNSLDSENIREYGDGRWTKPPRLAAFPAKENDKGRPVTVSIENPGIGSVCSHHFLPYGIQNNSNSKIVISYMPNEKLLGLSKIGRFVEWCLNRPSLQEEVTELIHDKIKEIAETDHVYVGLFNVVHTCEITRGAKQYSTTTTEDYSGIFDSAEMRRTIVDGTK
jgi:GTP cyclohydrolase IA